MTGEQLRGILKERGFNLSIIAELLEITPQALNSRLKTKTIKDSFIRDIEGVIGTKITYNISPINTEYIDVDHEKIINKEAINHQSIYDAFIKSNERIANAVEEIANSNKSLIDTNTKLVERILELTQKRVAGDVKDVAPKEALG